MKLTNWLEPMAKKFWIPRFTTGEMENSTTRIGYNYEIDQILYEDWEKYYPTEVTGFVKISVKEKIEVKWNQYGECTVKGVREKKYDLIRENYVQNEIDSGRNFFIGIICIVLVFIYLLLVL